MHNREKYSLASTDLFSSFHYPLATMRKVILVFPDVISLTDFILTHKVSKIIIDSSQKMLKGTISESHLGIACKQYGARVRESIVVKHFSN